MARTKHFGGVCRGTLLAKSVFLLGLTLSVGAGATPASRPYSGPISIGDRQSYSECLNEQRESLKSVGFKPWRFGGSKCTDCPLMILPVNPKIETQEVYAFIKALEDHKFELLNLYGASAQEYNLLAHMAIGILGRESEFFKSSRYRMKELAPRFVSAIKIVNAYSEYYTRSLRNSWYWESLSPEERARARKDHPRFTPNSRGPTQIKTLPEKIVEYYAVTPDSLYRPEHAAVATMGYLMEALEELKRRVVKDRLTYINPTNYVDYLPYIYFGSRWQLMVDKSDSDSKPAAEPWRNVYIKDMKAYMGWVELYEALPRNLAER